MKILVVDGDQLFARLLKAKLEKWGHRVVVENDGAAAYRRIQKESFRTVILDWDLPGMNGPELCTKIRAMRRARYTYVAFYTAKSDRDSLLAGLEVGADDYLLKPLNVVELRLRLKRGKRLLNLEDKLLESAGEDQSTGVVNAASFRQFFRVVLAEARRTSSDGTLMFVTVRNFGTVLREHGYNPAHGMMREVAAVLSRGVRESDLVAKVEENEFCVLLQSTHHGKCLPVVEKLATRLRNLAIYVEDLSVHPEIAVTVAGYPHGNLSYEQILDGSDDRLPVAS